MHLILHLNITPLKRLEGRLTSHASRPNCGKNARKCDAFRSAEVLGYACGFSATKSSADPLVSSRPK
jgi:hypothetical protein